MPFNRTRYQALINQTLRHSELYGLAARNTQDGSKLFVEKILDIMQGVFDEGIHETGRPVVSDMAPNPQVRPDVPGIPSGGRFDPDTTAGVKDG
jgi:hypothetical protein